MSMTDTRVRSPLKAAQELAPRIRASAAQIERERELPPALVDALTDAGIWRLLVPASLGGGQTDLPTYIEVVETLGRADASTAWCVNQAAVFATYAACLPTEIARQVFVDVRPGVVANTPSAESEALVVPGGYQVTGRMNFSTGSRHANHLAARARVIENGSQRLLASGEPDVRYLLLPVESAVIHDTWHTRGMRGTGTHEFSVDGKFVPEAWTFLPAAMPPAETGPLYVIPRTLVFACGDAATALGVARTALEALIELATGKVARYTGGLLRDQVRVQGEIGQAEGILRSGRALLRETVREAWQAICAEHSIDMQQRAALRVATTHAIRLAVSVVDMAYNAAGATAIFADHVLQRAFQDIHVISQHYQSRLSHYEAVGRYRLGLQPDPLAM
jgi:alkylation response protein AidB-like acyl-CoA dehydrogenase